MVGYVYVIFIDFFFGLFLFWIVLVWFVLVCFFFRMYIPYLHTKHTPTNF